MRRDLTGPCDGDSRHATPSSLPLENTHLSQIRYVLESFEEIRRVPVSVWSNLDGKILAKRPPPPFSSRYSINSTQGVRGLRGSTESCSRAGGRRRNDTHIHQHVPWCFCSTGFMRLRSPSFSDRGCRYNSCNQDCSLRVAPPSLAASRQWPPSIVARSCEGSLDSATLSMLSLTRMSPWS